MSILGEKPAEPGRGIRVRARSSAVLWRYRRRRLLRALRSDVLRDGSIVFASTIFLSLTTYLFHFIVSRKLGIAGYGELSSLLAGIMLISLPSGIVTMIFVKFAAEFHAVGDRGRLRRLIERSLLLMTSIAVAVFASGLALLPAIAAYLKIGERIPVVVALGVLAISMILPILRGTLQGTHDFKSLAISMLFEGAGKVALGVLLVTLGMGVSGALAGYLAASVCAAGYSLFALRHAFDAPRIRLTLDLRRLAATSLGVANCARLFDVINSIDVLTVKHYFDARQAGLFAIVSLAGKGLAYTLAFVPTVVLPKATDRALRSLSVHGILLQAVGGTAGARGSRAARHVLLRALRRAPRRRSRLRRRGAHALPLRVRDGAARLDERRRHVQDRPSPLRFRRAAADSSRSARSSRSTSITTPWARSSRP